MASATPARSNAEEEADATTPGPYGRLNELEHLVAELRAELDHLRRSLTEKVRTRRVVVVEPDGFERVVLSGVDIPSSGGVHVYARSQRRPADEHTMTYASIYAVEDEAWDGQEEVGVSL